MTVTGNVIRDLIPVYLAGEASSDTKRLVEQYAATDREIAALIAEANVGLPAPPPLNPDGEIATIQRTRKTVTLRSWLLAGALFFSLLPGSVRGGPDGVHWLVRSHPRLAALFAGVAIVLWTAYFVQRRRLRAAGL